MRKFLLSLVSFLALSASAQALDVLVQNESDHPIKLYVSHTWYKPSFLSEDKKWYYVDPHQSIKIKAHDESPTRVYMYRLNLKAAFNNAKYLGAVYAGSTALSVSNALFWIPAAGIALETTWKGFPFTMQTIDPKIQTEGNLAKAILIENYAKNKDTIQSVQVNADLKHFIQLMVANIGPMVSDHLEFTERYDQLADLLTHSDNLWAIYDIASQLELDLNEAIGLKIKAAQKKSIAQTIEDLRSIIDKIPTLKNEYNDLQQLQGIDFYIAAVKFMQKAKNMGAGAVVDLVPPEEDDDDIGDVSSSSSQQSDEEEFPVPPELD
ncbi:MAG: hypothetical protein Q8S31_03265 [Alphaproteobacteria bacterium]|nr:hypothetical protein [Alphaproteobacteria bacterium]